MNRIVYFSSIVFLLCFSSFGYSQNQIIQVQINSSSDDAEEKGLDSGDPGTIDLTSSDVELVRDGNDGNQFVGLRFESLPIPKGSMINNAYIQFTVDEDDDLPGTVNITVEDADNPVTFNETAGNISSRPTLAESVEWGNIPVWAEIGAAGEDQRTPDLSGLVQAIINRDGWADGNAISFIITGTGERVAESYDGQAQSAPILVVEYTAMVTETFLLGGSPNDTEIDLANGSLYTSSSDLEFTADGSSIQVVALRYPEVNIPSGSIIESAHIQFTVDEVSTGGDVDVLMVFEETGDAAPITAADNPIDRDYGGEVFWNDIPDWPMVDVAGAAQQTPDFTASIQAIVDRDDWAGGNAMLIGMLDPFVLQVPGYTGNTGKRVAQSWDKDPASSAKLVVTYFPPNDYQPGQFPVAAGSSWKYEDSGTDLHAADWTALDYDDESWKFGDALLGYGSAFDETTTLDFGENPAEKHPTTYLRHTFIVEDAAQYDSLVFNTLYDDGVIVYVNGVEAFRANMPEGDATYDTYAVSEIVGTAQSTYSRVKTGNLLQEGLNVIAVELHQASGISPDLGFDMSVDFTLPPLTPTDYPLEANSAWHYLDDGSSLDNVEWQDTSYADADDAWAWGFGILGYGDPVETIISFGDDPDNKYVTYYFRKEINIDLATLPDSLELGLLRDDGAIVYINGEEVRRDNLPEGDIDYLTTADETIAGGDEDAYFTSRLYASDFRQGVNTIAVEVHNRDVFSSDLSFDLYLRAAPVVNDIALGCSDGNEDHIACFTSIAPTAQTSNLLIPAGTHRFQQIHKQGSAYSIGGGTVPGNHDFTAYVGINGSSEEGYLSINHENTPGGVSMVGLHYDQSTQLWVVDSSQAVDFYNDDLVTTTRNCSGGITPWGTILTAEETLNSGDANNDGYQDVGWLVEIDPATASVMDYGNGKQEKLWAIGRISHENAVVLDDQATLFTGEDGGSSALFKFIADTPGNLTAGTLYALQLNDPLSGGEPTGTTGTWIQIPNTTQEDRNNTRALAISLGATNFNGIEDVEVHPLTGQMYFTSKGNGRVYRFTNNAETVTEFETFVGGASYVLNTEDGVFTEPWGGGNDNLTFDDQGNLWVLQDGGRNYVWLVRPDHTQDEPKVELFSSMPIGSEPCGLTFSPDYRFGFMSVQHPSGANTPQIDATGNEVAFNASATFIFSRGENLGLQAPVTNFEADNITVMEGQSVTFFDLSSNFPNAWDWTFEGGMPATSTDAMPTVTYMDQGTYDVSLLTANDAGDGTVEEKTDYITVTPMTGIRNVDAEYNLSIFPNPTSGQVNLRMDLNGGENVRIEVLDLMGRRLADFGNLTAASGTDVWSFDLGQKVAESQILVFKITVDGQVIDRKVQFAK